MVKLFAGLNQMAWPWDGIFDFFSEFFENLTESFYQIIITPIVIILYGLQMGFFYLIDCVQGVFRSMAGLSVYYYQGVQQEGDMVMSLLMDQTIVNIFWAVLVVAIMLLFVTTIVAIIRSEFTEKNAKGPIIAKSIKALAYFAVVPVACLLGVWISNVFLRSFDKATSLQTNALSATVFFASAHNANRVRNGDDVLYDKIKADSEMLKALNASANDDKDTIATKIDEAFLKQASTVKSEYSTDGLAYMVVMKRVSDTQDLSKFSHYHIGLVYYFYDLFGHYNFLIGYVGGFTAAMLLLQSCLYLIQRLYELALLFVISPAFIAFMPLDDGAKYKGWCGQFVKRVGAAYGPIIGLNLMFIILSRLQDVNIFDPNDTMGGMFNAIMQCVFMIVGLIAVKEFSALISSLIGSEDANAKGSGMKDNVMQMGAKMATGTVAAAKMGASVVGGVAKSINKSADIKQAIHDESIAKGQKEMADSTVEAAKKHYEENPESADAKEWYEQAVRDQERVSADYEKKKSATKKAEKGTFQGGLKNLREGYENGGIRGMTKSLEENTAFGRSYAELANAAGLGRWATVAGRDKAAEEGKSFLGNAPIFRDKDGNWMSRTEATKAEKKAKEGKDAQAGYEATGQAVSNALDANLARATIFRGAMTGTPSGTEASSTKTPTPPGSTPSAPTSMGGTSSSAATVVGGIPGFSNLGHVYDADAYKRREEERLSEAKKEKKKLDEYEEDEDTGEMVRRSKNGKELDRMSKNAYNKKVKDADNAIDEHTRHIEDKMAELRGENIADKSERAAYVESAKNLENFKALADMIAEAISNAQMKTKTTFDPGQQVDVRKLGGGKVKLEATEGIPLEKEFYDQIEEISTILKNMVMRGKPKG